MPIDVIGLSIPLFLALIAIEIAYVAWRKQPFYRVNDSVNDLSAGILSQLGGVFLKVVTLGTYLLVYHYASLQVLLGAPAIPNHWLSWVVCFILVDFAYYWFHRLSHETALGWSTHVVHHQSEEYNLTVALRQSTFGPLVSWPFYLPIAFLGFTPEMYVVSYGVNLIYQFWIHTRTIDKLPRWIEFLFNTPSHHRVHHGKNPKYCDKNHAGVFMIWDRMFGTFVPEEEEPVYGITVPLNSWNPVHANTGPTANLFRDFWRARSLRDKLGVLFNKPGWRPAYMGGIISPREVNRSTYQVYDPPMPRAVLAYSLAQFALIVPLTLYALKQGHLVSGPVVTANGIFYMALLTTYITLTLTNIGGLHEGHAWAYFSELGRVLTTAGVAAFALVAGYPLGGALALLACILSVTTLVYWRAQFLKPELLVAKT